MKALRLQT